MANTGKNPYGGEMSSANMEWMRRYDPRYWQQFQNLPNANQPGGAPPPPGQPPPVNTKPQYTPKPPAQQQAPQAPNAYGLIYLSPGVYRDAKTGEIVYSQTGQRPMQGRAGQPSQPAPNLQQLHNQRLGGLRTGGGLTQAPQAPSTRPGPIDPNTGTAPPPMPGSPVRPGQMPRNRGTRGY